MPYATKPELDATKIPTPLDVAWAAGIYEGEGTVRETHRVTTQIIVTQKDPEILYRLRELFGGSIRLAASKNVPVENQCHQWNICGDRSRLFVALTYEYLSTRRKASIDRTKILDFMRGKSTVGITYETAQALIALYSETRYSQSPRNVARRKTMRQEPWYIKRREESAASLVNERVM